jgi:hypothetical protein
VRALGGVLEADTLVLARPGPQGAVELFFLSVADGRERRRGRLLAFGEQDRAIWAQLEALGLAETAPVGALRRTPPPGGRTRPPRNGGGSSPWPWLAPTLVAVAAAAGAAIYFALPGPRDDARIVPGW